MSLSGQAMVSWVEEEKYLPTAQKQLNSPILELAAKGKLGPEQSWGLQGQSSHPQHQGMLRHC